MEIEEPGQGEIRVRNKAIGLNFIDVYFRKGVYKAPAMPFTPGYALSLFVHCIKVHIQHCGYISTKNGFYLTCNYIDHYNNLLMCILCGITLFAC